VPPSQRYHRWEWRDHVMDGWSLIGLNISFVKSKANPELRLASQFHFNQANWYRHLRASLSLLLGANSLRVAEMQGGALLACLMLMQFQIHLAS